jgi:regulator of protease activity HflC (stomatin/prohibitin superfamily)
VTVFVNAIMYYKVANAIHAVANVDDYGGSARLLAATTLRNVLGTLTLGDILCQRESIANEMRVILLNIWSHQYKDLLRLRWMREQNLGVLWLKELK